MVFWRLHLGRTALDSREVSRAIQEFDVALSWDRANGETHFWLARAYRKSGDMNRVREHLQRAWTLNYSTDVIEREEWLAMAQSGQMREAHAQLSGLLLDPRDDGREICEAYVNGYFLACRFREALKLLEVWRQEYPDDSQPYLFEAQYFNSIGDHRAAADACRAGLEREPERHDLRLLLATHLVDLHEFAEAETWLRELLAQHGDQAAALAVWSDCLVSQGRIEEAEGVLARLLELDPDNVPGRISAAQLDLDAGRTARALSRIQQVVDQQPYHIQARYLLATALQASGDREAASLEFRRAEVDDQAHRRVRVLWDALVIDDPFNVDYRYEVGTLLMNHGSPDAAASWLHSVLEIDPYHTATHAALTDYYRQSGQHDLAGLHAQFVRQSEVQDPTVETAPDLMNSGR